MQKVKHTVVEKISDTLEKNYMPYAMSVIVSRAIPEIDGFKPSHRKLLYTMYKMGLLSGSRTKSANVVGQTMKLNPHGDAAIYETMVRLTRGNASLLHPYVDSKGNFGKQYSRDMQFAASRYTEVKLDKICTELFRAIDKDVVTFTPNYDATMQEPTLLPATFPSVLVNANQGIAVGMASNICPFNLREVCSATIAYIKNPDCVIEKYIKGPDFPGGGEFIVDREELAKVFDSGRGTLRLRARYRVDLKNRLIEIYEIPYSTTVEAVLDNLAELVKAGKAKEISDVRDETDLNGLKLTIELKRAAEPEALMNRLFKQTSLQANFACNFNVLIDGRPRVLGVKQLIGEWLNFRRTCVRRETAFDLQEKQAKLHLLEGLNTIMLDIDKAIRIIRETENETDVIPNLCRGFAIDAVQAEYIAEIKLRNLNREYLLKRTADRSELTEEIAQLQNRLASTSLLDAEIIRTLQQVAEKYGQDRRTVLIDAGEITEITGEDLIEDYRLKYFLTAHGYLKKLPLTSLRSAGELKIKDEDEIISEIEAGNRDEIMVFTDQANVYKISGHEIKDCKPSELGEYLPGLLDFAPEEKVIYLHVPGEYVGDFMFAFANGKVARVPVSAYKTKTKRRKLVAAYSDKSPLVGIEFAPENKSYVLISNLSKVLIFDSEQIPAKVTRNNQGVQVMSAKRNSVVNKFSTPEAAGIQDSPYYRTKNLPAIGYYLKEDMVKNRQMTIS
ncbi:DNA gyrase/topoisomerase IV, A subunit [Mageeibacillus indolicus UPII9-5]|uniref:DNA topoisomerase (ATP-hydrolyzing) n=1 Tax=Mageeibacillus indolicus (strain UPII9-5) TaxID=699246 RepID=D3R271_MAGIU|nr:DNA gyrase subunit A [Mageeibacillus indolicus]ADC90892.1 DNA gyrase/topoisomerase IV, A subunit [Mageeibacillus indolicus UPII9-5]